MVEFAIVVVLLIAILYGIISYGLILAAQSTLTQGAADATRSGLITSTPVATAEGQACNDIAWMAKTCGKPVTYDANACTFSPNPAYDITSFACQMKCPSNVNAQCLKVTLSYNYSANPLFPVLPGLGIITPSTLTSANVLQTP